MMSSLSRRSFLLLAGLGAVSLSPAGVLAASGRNTGFSAVVVDVSAMRDRGDGIRAEWVEQDLIHALRKRFRPYLRRNAPRLLIEIDSLSFGDFAGGAEHSSDFLKGEALIVEKNGKVSNRYPILLAQSPSSTAVWYSPDVDRRRITTLCNTFAAWVERYVN